MQRLITSALLASLIWLPGCGTSGPAQPMYDSPQAAYDAFSKAGQEGDWKTLAASLTPESQEAMAAMLMLPAGMMAAFDESAGKELQAILDRHELSDEVLQNSPDELPVADKPAFIADVAGWLMTQGGESSDLGIPTGELSEITVDGDEASATIGGEPISFQQINGGWLVHLQTPASEVDDVALSTEPLQGVIGGEPWQVKSVGEGPFGGYKLSASEADSSPLASGPEIMLGEAWESLKPGTGKLGGARNITFFVPPGNNTVCMTGKYEVSETDDSWVLLLYASEDEDNTINGRVELPKQM